MTEPFMLRAMLAALALAFIAAPIGCIVLWRRLGGVVETIGPGSLLGAALAIAVSIDLRLAMIGMALVIALLLLRLERQTVLTEKSLSGVLAPATLAIGIVAASLVRGPNLDLMAILFGDIYSVTQRDITWILAAGSAAYVGLIWIWNSLLAVAANEDLAAVEGVPVERTKAVFILVLALVVAIAIKIVGALLTIAFLTLPAAAARPFSETPEQMAFFATIFATLGVAFGLFVSVALDAPGGPSIVLVLAVMLVLAAIPVALSRRT